MSPDRQSSNDNSTPGFLITEMQPGIETSRRRRASPPEYGSAPGDGYLDEIGFDFEPDEGEEEFRASRRVEPVEPEREPAPAPTSEERTTLLDRPPSVRTRTAPPVPERPNLASTVVDQAAPDLAALPDAEPPSTAHAPSETESGGDAFDLGEDDLPPEIPLPEGDWPEDPRGELPPADSLEDAPEEDLLGPSLAATLPSGSDLLPGDPNEEAAPDEEGVTEVEVSAAEEGVEDPLGEPPADEWGEPDDLLTWSAVSDDLPPAMRDAARDDPGKRAGEKLERDAIDADVLSPLPEAAAEAVDEPVDEPGEEAAPATAAEAPPDLSDGTFGGEELPPAFRDAAEPLGAAGEQLPAEDLAALLPAEGAEPAEGDAALADGEDEEDIEAPESVDLTTMRDLPESAPDDPASAPGEKLERDGTLEDVFSTAAEAASKGDASDEEDAPDAAELFREDLDAGAADLGGMDVDAALEAGLEAEREAEREAAEAEARAAEEVPPEESAADLFGAEGPEPEGGGDLEQIFGGGEIPDDFAAAVAAAPVGGGAISAAPAAPETPAHIRAAQGAVLAVAGSVALVDHVLEIRKHWRLYVNLLAAAISAVSVTIIVLGLMR